MGSKMMAEEHQDKSFRGQLRKQDASEIAETAIILPLLFMILLAIFWFGQAYHIYGVITHAAREGARAAVVTTCATCAASTTTPAQNAETAITNAIAAAHMNMSQVQQPVTPPTLYACGTQGSACGPPVQCDGGTGGETNICVQTNVQLASCSTTPPGEATCGTSVSFVYQNGYSFTIPLTNLNLQNITFPAEAQMRVETQ
jgi:Flp pilus assembly protein TadG